METRAPSGAVPLINAAPEKPKRAATVTDIPPTKSVEETKPGEKTGAGSRQLAEEEARRAANRMHQESLRPPSLFEVKTHEATGSVVLQTSDYETGLIKHQFPNNATLKERAYMRYDALQGTATIKRTV
jgi:hypothetical protein